MAWIGTSGWSYDHWEDVLYPRGTPGLARLDWYVGSFRTVELNASFYRWPREATFASWRRRLPDGFRLTVKAPRGLTHAKRLYAPEEWIERIGRGWRQLGDRQGMVLVQLHPAHRRDDDRLRWFLDGLPDGMPVAVEFRHPSWLDEDVFGMLADRGIAYVVMSGAKLPCVLRATARQVYVRLHGPDREHLYGGSYAEADLRWWADRIREWEGNGHEVYAYFNNDGGGHAVHNARALTTLLA